MDLLRLQYSFTYKLLDCANYGVASKRKRLIVFGARRGFVLPDWPAPQITEKDAFVTVKDVIHDLSQSQNKTTDVMGIIRCTHKQRDKYSEHAKALWEPTEEFEVEDSDDEVPEGTRHYWVYNHITGRGVGNTWTAAKPNMPLQTVRTSPSDRWACKHWGAS